MTPNKIILINDIESIHKIKKSSLENNKVFSFNIQSHKYLEKLNINHIIAENYLSENERIEIFDLVVHNHDWYSKIDKLKDFEFQKINLLGSLDTVEFHTYLMDEIINFFTIKKIIETEKPTIVITSLNFYKILKLITKNNVKLEIYSKNNSESLQWDKITIKQNIGRFPISFNLSRSTYTTIKKKWEKVVCSISNLWYNFNKSEQKTILFCEFYPPLYEKLLLNLKEHGFNIIFLNQRKPAVYDLDSIKTLKKCQGKIINFDHFLNSKQKNEIKVLSNNYLKKLETIFSDDDIFKSSFLFEDNSLWYIFKDKLFETYRNRIPDYVYLLYISNELFKKINISCILTLNEIGETEKSILNSKNNVPSILLEHGFGNFFPESARFNILANYSNFKDKIAVWSSNQKDFLINFHGIDSDRILVTGSPRHDNLFTNNSKISDDFTVLIAPTPITQIQGFDHTEIHLKFESTIKEIFSQLKKNKMKIIVKLHPSQSIHNEIIKKVIKEFDKNIPIHLISSITELINTCDAVITITPEGWAPSTVILESLILKKPVMNIILDNNLYDFQYVQDNAIFAVSSNSELNTNISKFLLDNKFRKKLISNGENFVENYLHNPMHASKYLSNIINSIQEKN